MKKKNILYWTITGLFAVFMAFTAVGDHGVAKKTKLFLSSVKKKDLS